MILHITKKLAEELDLSPVIKPVRDELHSWRAGYVQEDGYSFVVFMNDASRFTIVINEATSVKLRALTELFIRTLRDTLLALGVNPEVVSWYIEECGGVTYSKNSDRKKTAHLNKSINDTWWALRELSGDVELSLAVNRVEQKVFGTDEYIAPMAEMLELLSKYGLPVRKCRAFDLNVRLDLDGKDAVRKLRVPADITFERLHELLQKAFGWHNHQYFCFGMFHDWRENNYTAPDIELIMDEDQLDANPDAIVMKGLKLSDYVPVYRKILYTYDYADDWHHFIEVENIIDDCSDDLPILLSGFGDAPPEDVGGPGGFADFLAILADPSHGEYNNKTKWAKSQWWNPFDFDLVARRINHNHNRIRKTTKPNVTTPEVVITKVPRKLSDAERHVFEYMRSHPYLWGTVIASEPQWTCNSCCEPARIIVDDNHADEIARLCDDCYNRVMAKLTGSKIPDIVPKLISVKGRNGKPVEFEVEFLIFMTGMSLIATEVGKRKRKTDVFGELGDDFNTLFETLKTRIKKALSVTYMKKDGSLAGSKAVGYIEYNRDRGDHDIIIDGLPFTWAELEKNISIHGGWKIKIEFGSTGDELD